MNVEPAHERNVDGQGGAIVRFARNARQVRTTLTPRPSAVSPGQHRRVHRVQVTRRIPQISHYLAIARHCIEEYQQHAGTYISGTAATLNVLR